MATALLLLFYFGFPILVIYLSLKYTWIDKIGAVLINYAVGILMANSGYFPEGMEKMQDLLTTILIPVAIPMLLFTADIETWLKLFGKTTLAFILGLIALIITVYGGYFIFAGKIDDLWEISGMLVGVYTGGTPNLASIKTALNISADRFIITHTSDMVSSSILLLFFLSFAQRLFSFILPKFKINENDTEKDISTKIAEDINEFKGITDKENRLDILKSLGLSLFVFSIGGGISMLVPEEFMMLTAILTITTLGILFSFRPKVKELKKSFQSGMYLIHVFSLVVASMADFSKFEAGESLWIFYYVLFVVFGSLFIHLILSYFLKVDTDTFIIATVAMVLSPPFVPVVAGALKNKHIIISGITIGIIGYAVGNYLGVFVAYSLK